MIVHVNGDLPVWITLDTDTGKVESIEINASPEMYRVNEVHSEDYTEFLANVNFDTDLRKSVEEQIQNGDDWTEVTVELNGQKQITAK